MYAVHLSLTKQNASNYTYQCNESQRSHPVSIPTTGWDWQGIFALHHTILLARAVVKSGPVRRCTLAFRLPGQLNVAWCAVDWAGLAPFAESFAVGAPKPGFSPPVCHRFRWRSLSPSSFCDTSLQVLPQAIVKRWEVAEACFSRLF